MIETLLFPPKVKSWNLIFPQSLTLVKHQRDSPHYVLSLRPERFRIYYHHSDYVRHLLGGSLWVMTKFESTPIHIEFDNSHFIHMSSNLMDIDDAVLTPFCTVE